MGTISVLLGPPLHFLLHCAALETAFIATVASLYCQQSRLVPLNAPSPEKTQSTPKENPANEWLHTLKPSVVAICPGKVIALSLALEVMILSMSTGSPPYCLELSRVYSNKC